MKKKILIGSLLVLTLLLLMPSIPAIQTKTIQEGRYQELHDKLVTIPLDDSNGKIVFDGILFPNLYEFVLYIQHERWVIFKIFYDFSTEPDIFGDRVIYPLFYLWSCVLSFRFWIWSDFWRIISERLGLGWEIPIIPE